MTIAGFSVIGPDHAFAWADSQCFIGSQPAADRPKILINTLAGLVATGTGYTAILQAAAEVIQNSATFDEIVELLPRILRREMWTVAGEALAARSPLPWQAIGIIGWSIRYGRAIGALFEDRSQFQPSFPVRTWRAPAIEVEVDVADEHSIAEIALAQFAALRVQNPAATPSGLVIAEVGRDGIWVYAPRDLESGRRWDRGLMTAPPSMAARGPGS